MAKMAKIHRDRNKIKNMHVYNKMSVEFDLPKAAEKIDVVVSETLGTLLLGESQLDYVSDARARLCNKNVQCIPYGGAQYVYLIACEHLTQISRINRQVKDINLSAMNLLQDTARLQHTKSLGFRLNSVPYTTLTNRTCLFEVNFAKHNGETVPLTKSYIIDVVKNGEINAAVLSWEVWGDEEREIVMSTHPEITKEPLWGFARDLQWGQGIQLLEDRNISTLNGYKEPVPMIVTEGEKIKLTMHLSPNRRLMQITVERYEHRLKGRAAKVKCLRNLKKNQPESDFFDLLGE